MRNVRLGVVYSDGVTVQGLEKSKRLLIMDKEIFAAAYAVFRRVVTRRIRIRSIGLALEDFVPLFYQPDLFEVETEAKSRRLQEAVDKIQNRYGCLKPASVPILSFGVSPSAKLQLKP